MGWGCVQFEDFCFLGVLLRSKDNFSSSLNLFSTCCLGTLHQLIAKNDME